MSVARLLLARATESKLGSEVDEGSELRSAEAENLEIVTRGVRADGMPFGLVSLMTLGGGSEMELGSDFGVDTAVTCGVLTGVCARRAWNAGVFDDWGERGVGVSRAKRSLTKVLNASLSLTPLGKWCSPTP